MSREIRIPIGVYNEYKLSVMKGDADGNPIPGTRRDVTGWFHNLITDTGLENFGNALSVSPINWARGCRVGEGNTPPVFADTNLQDIVATTVTKLSIVYSRDTGATPPYVQRETIYRFATGVAAGNLTEVGLVGASSDGSGSGGALNVSTTCSTRALILDGVTPTTVTVLSDEILDVTARQRLYVPDDVAGIITPTGGVVSDIDYVIRACEIDQGPTTNQGGWGGGASDTGWDFTDRDTSGHGENAFYVGASSAIGANTASPAGTKVDVDEADGVVTTLSYVAASHYRDIKMTAGLGTALTGINNADGIGAVMMSYGSCSFQIGFTPRMVKTSDMQFDITLRLAWARYTP